MPARELAIVDRARAWSDAFAAGHNERARSRPRAAAVVDHDDDHDDKQRRATALAAAALERRFFLSRDVRCILLNSDGEQPS